MNAQRIISITDLFYFNVLLYVFITNNIIDTYMKYLKMKEYYKNNVSI